MIISLLVTLLRLIKQFKIGKKNGLLFDLENSRNDFWQLKQLRIIGLVWRNTDKSPVRPNVKTVAGTKSERPPDIVEHFPVIVFWNQFTRLLRINTKIYL